MSWHVRCSDPSGDRAANMRDDKPIDFWLAVGASLVAGGMMVAAPGEVVATSGAVAILLRLAGRLTRGTLAFAVLALGIGAARAERAVSHYEAERQEADRVLGAPLRCGAHAVVSASPVLVRDSLKWDAQITGLSCEDHPVFQGWTGRATLYGGPSDLARGDELDVVASLACPQRLWNPSTGDPRPAEAYRSVVRTGAALDVRIVRRSRGFLAWIDRARARVRGRIESGYPPSIRAMARALVLGESDLAAEDDRSFRASGLSHLLAVSGMHLVLVLSFGMRALQAAFVRSPALPERSDVGRYAACFGIVLAWIYAEFAGAGGSTLRAAWMASVALAARAAGRKGEAVRSFGVSALVMGLTEPLVAFDVSFALSAGATAGLLAFSGPFGDALASVGPARAAPVARAIGTTLAASLPCVPLTARFAPTLPLGGVLANVFAVPLGESAALPLCLIHAVLGACTPHPSALEAGSALAASGALVLVRAIAHFASSTWAVVAVPAPTTWQVGVLGVAMAALVLGRAAETRGLALRATAGALVALFGLEFVAVHYGAPVGVLRVTFLDVGQGDAALVDLPDGEALVIDGGGLVGSPIDVGARVLAPELRARRRNAIALAVLTHPHPDHYGGLATGLAAVRLGALWDTGQGEAEGAGDATTGGYAQLLAMVRGERAKVVRPGALCGSHRVGGAVIDVLAPCPDFTSDRGPNDNSLVLRIAFGARAFLFVGDAEKEEEADLIAHAASSLRADVLKVGHHGSRTSSAPAFLAAVAPSAAVISSGRRNRFGHPHAATLASLAAAGARVFRTDTVGAVVATTDGRALELHSMGSER